MEKCKKCGEILFGIIYPNGLCEDCQEEKDSESVEKYIKAPIKLLQPFKKIITDSENYGLIITDAKDIIYYWNFDGSFDGYSTDCNCEKLN